MNESDELDDSQQSLFLVEIDLCLKFTTDDVLDLNDWTPIQHGSESFAHNEMNHRKIIFM